MSACSKGDEGSQPGTCAGVQSPAAPHAWRQAGAAACLLSKSTHSSGLRKVAKKEDRQGLYATDSGLRAAVKSCVEP